MGLYEDLFCQCQTFNKLTVKICCELEQLTDDERYQLVSTEKDGVTPLGVAVKLGKTYIVRYLLNVCKADVDQLCTVETKTWFTMKLTPLMFAKDIFVARILAICGANLKAVSAGGTPLHWQCFFENYKVVEYLIRKGADVTVPMEDGNTILHCCIDNPELYKLIISSGANVNAQNKLGQTPMHWAIAKNKAWAVELLFENTANPKIRNNEGFDAIRLACKQRNREIVDYLATNANYSDTERADVYELLGSFYVSNNDLNSGVRCWRTAMEIRLNNGGKFLERTRSDVPEAPPYEGYKEIRTMDDLDAIAIDQHAILVQTFVNKSRILGPHKMETVQSLANICATVVGLPEYYNNIYPLQYSLDLAAVQVDKYPQNVKMLCTLCNVVVLISGAELKMSTEVSDNCIPFQMILKLAELTSATINCTESKTNYHFLIALLNLMLVMPKTGCQQEQLTDLVELLVKKRIRNENGQSLLHFAALAIHPRMDDLPGLTDHPVLKILKTINFRRAPVVKLLLECGHPVDCVTDAGSTPLHFALRKYDVDTVNCLLDHGAHIDQADGAGFQPIRALENVKGVNTFHHVTLKCLAANVIVTHKVPYGHLEFPAIETFIATHSE